MLKKFLFTAMIFVITMQCVFAEETQKPKAYDNPAGEIEYHDVCLYVKRPVDSPLSYYHYPVLDGETAEVPDGSVIKLNLSKFDIINSVSIRIMDEKENVYYSSEFSSLSSSIINIDGGVFTGKAVLEMGIEYKDGVKEKYTYHLNKTVSYRDIKPEKLIISKSADGGLYLTFELDGILNVRTSEVSTSVLKTAQGGNASGRICLIMKRR